MNAATVLVLWSLINVQALDHLSQGVGRIYMQSVPSKQAEERKGNQKTPGSDSINRFLELLQEFPDGKPGADAELERATIVAIALPERRGIASSLVQFLREGNELRAEYAGCVLSTIGADAAAIVDDLIELLRMSGTRKALVSKVLGSVGAKADKSLPQLKMLLGDKDPDVRVEAALAIWKIEKNLKDSLPVLISILREKPELADESTIQRAIAALGKMGTEAKDAVPSLQRILKEGAWILQFEAAIALVNIHNSELATQFLSKHILDDDTTPNLTSRIQSAVALLKNSEKAKMATELLIQHTDGKKVKRNLTALTYLPDTSLSREEVSALLTGALTDSDPLIRQMAAHTLGHLGKSAKGALEELARHKDDEDQYVRWQVFAAIRQITSK